MLHTLLRIAGYVAMFAAGVLVSYIAVVWMFMQAWDQR